MWYGGTVKPFLVLIAASALTWAAFMAIHGLPLRL
jgi:hypothetical protein